MNYSEMTDFEINKAVAIACGYAEENCEFGWSGKPDVGVEWSDETGYPTKSFNYCNSWADAGPIIEKENISLTCHQSRDEWAAIFNRHCMAANNNPLRAAMECFLMKKERENAA